MKPNITSDISLLATIPRSGCNYFAALLEVCLGHPRIDRHPDCPCFLTENEKQKSDVFWLTHDNFWSHLPYEDITFPATEKLSIVQIRNPLDVAYSLTQMNICPLDTVIEGYNRFADKWLFDFNQDTRLYGNRLVVVYEELMKSPKNILAQSCEHFGYEVDDEKIENSIVLVGDKQNTSSNAGQSKHLKNTHTLTETYNQNRTKFKVDNSFLYDKITNEELRNLFYENCSTRSL